MATKQKPKTILKTFLQLFLACVILSSLMTFGYYLGLQDSEIGNKNGTITTSLSNSKKSTEKWETFTSTIHNFKIQHPTHWKLNEKLGLTQPVYLSSNYLDEMVAIFEFKDLQGDYYQTFTISVFKNNGALTLEEFGKMYRVNLMTNPEENLATFVRDFDLSSEKAKEFSVFSFDMSETHIFVVHNGLIYQIQYVGETPNDPNKVENDAIYKKMLDSFEFTK